MNRERASRTKHPVRRLPEQQAFSYPQQQVRAAHYPQGSSHRAGHYAGIHPEDAPYSTGDGIAEEEQDGAFYEERPHTSVVRYDRPGGVAQQTRYDYELRPEILPSVRRRASAATQTKTTAHASAAQAAPAKQQRRIRVHWLSFVGIGAIIALLLWFGFTELGAWWQTTKDDQTYTQAFRTFSVDAVVGHNHDSPEKPSHFIVQNDHRHIIIIELPANDSGKAMIYSGPTLLGDGEDRTPVTLTFERNEQSGLVDMVLHIYDQTITYTNNGVKFVPPPPGQQ